MHVDVSKPRTVASQDEQHSVETWAFPLDRANPYLALLRLFSGRVSVSDIAYSRRG